MTKRVYYSWQGMSPGRGSVSDCILGQEKGAQHLMYDLIIIGAGPAGLSAAVYGRRAGLDLIVIEQTPMGGGQVVDTYEVDNYLGMPGVNGFDLAQKFRSHADGLGLSLIHISEPTRLID